MGILEGLHPKKVFHFFEEISNIPRGSGNEEESALYCIDFASKRGLFSYRDSFNNVLIKKVASKGKSDNSTIILQGHLDMVCEKNAETEHNFETDGIRLVLEGDNIKALNTTLGADNGIACAIMLAVLDDDTINHPPIECLFTSMEEIGLIGALAFDYSMLEGKTVINLDSEQHGVALAGCAGGVRSSIEIGAKLCETCLESAVTIKIMILGLKGGHSGSDIHLSRANANKLIGRLLCNLRGKIDYELVEITGGSKDNAIPREAFAKININDSDLSSLETLIEAFELTIVSEYEGIENNICIKCEQVPLVTNVITRDIADKISYAIMAIPDGVMTMSSQMEGLVETSSNLGVITFGDDKVTVTSLVRSSVDSKRQYAEEVIQAIANLTGSNYTESSKYPGWRYNPDSAIREKAKKVYNQITGQDLKVEAIHAGLECGVFANNIKGADIISLGPDMWDVHTPDERLSVSSVSSFYDFLVKLIEQV